MAGTTPTIETSKDLDCFFHTNVARITVTEEVLLILPELPCNEAGNQRVIEAKPNGKGSIGKRSLKGRISFKLWFVFNTFNLLKGLFRTCSQFAGFEVDDPDM